MLKKMKLGKKLVGGFLLVAAIALSIGVIGIVKLQQVNAAMTEMYEIKLAPLLQLANAAREFQRNSYLCLQELSSDPSHATQFEPQIMDSARRIGAMTEEYKKSVRNPEEQRRFEEFMQARPRFTQTRNHAVELAKSGKMEEARQYFLTETAAAGDRYESTLRALMDVKGKDARQMATDNAGLAASASWWMGAAVLLGVLLAIALGTYLTLSITRPLNCITQAAAMIAEGDVEHKIDYRSGDELGSLADSFRRMCGTIKERAAAAERISQGDLEVTVAVASEKDVLGKGLSDIITTLKRLLEEMKEMSDNFRQGNGTSRWIEVKSYQGTYVAVAQCINDMMLDQITITRKLSACLQEFSKGNFDAELERFPERKHTLTTALSAYA